MWTSDRRESRRRDEVAALGQVSLGGDPAGVYLGGERRWLPVYSPGGYRWRPALGQRVLVVRTGQELEAPCVAGVRQPLGDLEPGEVQISGPGSMVKLNSRGLSLEGQVLVNGTPLEQLIALEVAKALGGGGTESEGGSDSGA